MGAHGTLDNLKDLPKNPAAANSGQKICWLSRQQRTELCHTIIIQ